MHRHTFGKDFPLPAWLGVGLLAVLGLSVPTWAAEFAGTHLISDGGKPANFEVALNEINVRRPNAASQAQSVPEFATADAIRVHAELLARTTGQEVELVLYQAGQPRNELTRRVLTRQVLVHLAPGMDAAALATANGAASKGELSFSPGYHVFEAPAPGGSIALAAAIQGRPGVHSAEPLLARLWTKMFVPNDTLFANQWHLLNTGQNGALAGMDINVTNVWDRFRGTGITIGIVDDGLQGSHPDLTNNYNASLGLDVNDGDFDPSPNTTNDFHGTAVGGVAAARGNNNLGVSGVAFEATLAGIRFSGGPATFVQVGQCLTHSNQAIQVYNNSWGASSSYIDLFPLPVAISNALVSGTQNGRGGLGSVFIFSSGNDGSRGGNGNYSGIANNVFVLPVAALNDRLARASYSTPGAHLVISAPAGNDATRLQGTTTTDLVGDDGYNTSTTTDPLEYSDRDYTSRFNGTSSAAPVVSGVVALMLQANPGLGWRDVKEILIRSATKNDPTNTGWATNAAGFRFSHDFGAGLINAGAAVALATNWVNLGAQTTFTAAQSNLNIAIPDNTTNGVVVTVPVSGSNMRLENVNLLVDIQHPIRGDLEVLLTSPSGMTSLLAVPHNDFNADYSGWTFLSVHNWGELADGNWTVRINDRRQGNGGILNTVRLEFLGTYTNINQVPTNPPTITSQPLSRTVTQGSTVSFSVDIATNATQPVSYQWRYNGSNILNAVNRVLTLTNVPAASAGLYSVRVANPVATNFSAEAALFVNDPPVIITNPTNQSITLGSNVTFTVAATGTAPFEYQWRRNGAPISGAISQSYTITGVQTNHSGTYDVLVGNSFSSVFSSGATLTVLPPFSLSPQPTNVSVTVGGSAAFTVGAVGLGAFTGPFSYQWLLNGSPIAGATNTTLSLTGVGLGSSGGYTCLVNSPLGSLTSSNALLTVFNPFTVGSAAFQLGGLFQLTASGDNGRSYRLESSTNLINWTPVVTNVVAGGSATFTDSTASGKVLRFYRIVLLP